MVKHVFYVGFIIIDYRVDYPTIILTRRTFFFSRVLYHECDDTSGLILLLIHVPMRSIAQYNPSIDLSLFIILGIPMATHGFGLNVG